MLNWENISTEKVISGVTADDVSYLKLFLADYSREFKLKTVVAGCRNCIADYHKKYTIRMKAKNNECQYRLKDKYNGIQLEQGSSVMVNNGNITNEYGETLLQNRGAQIFAKLPTEPIVKSTDAPKPKRARTKKQ